LSYAIETVNLVKRYPTRSGLGRSTPRHGMRNVQSPGVFSNIFDILKRRKCHYIEALRGVNLRINEGEVFGLLGPNGAGKTTLIKILCTLVIHDEGEVRVMNFDVRKEPARVLKTLQAILPESRGFDWRLTGRQNLGFYSLLYGIKEIEARKRINSLLEITGLKERADDGYQRYSTGMQRKLLLCRALLRNTPILLFDEPTVGLDPASAAEFRSLLRDKLCNGEGKTILISTHNLNEAENICDRIAILNRGKILACDTLKNIQNQVFDKKSVHISFAEVIPDDKLEKMKGELKTIPGIESVTLETSQRYGYGGVSLQLNKDFDLSSIMEVISGSAIKVNSINTREPGLEDAFLSLVKRGMDEPENR
jgi:ABC-2 type transport system ATP-binding protein